MFAVLLEDADVQLLVGVVDIYDLELWLLVLLCGVFQELGWLSTATVRLDMLDHGLVISSSIAAILRTLEHKLPEDLLDGPVHICDLLFAPTHRARPGLLF